MLQATVIGRATSTRKHKSLAGQRLLVCQPLKVDGSADGDVFLALDRHGAAQGDRVLLSSDGRGLRELLGKQNTPARWWTLGIVDEGQPYGPTPELLAAQSTAEGRA
ncbi:EutN/CcmL family microcompartment protein [Phycisphaeraceae bacterium D3-23]